MFTAAEYHTLRKRCPKDLQRFLTSLSIKPPADEAWEDAAMVRELDEKVSKTIVHRLCSKSFLDGCYSLLERAGVSYEFSDTLAELLGRIADNQRAVRAAMVEAPSCETKAEPQSETSSAAAEAASKKHAGALYYFLGVGALGADLVYVLLAATYSMAVAAVLGLGGASLLFQGRRLQRRGSVPPPRRDDAIVIDVSTVRFSQEEADRVLETLLLARGLYQAL